MTTHQTQPPCVIVLSETDGRPYYAALERLHADHQISLLYRESSCLRLLAHDCLHKGIRFRHFKKCARNFWFRFTAWRLKGNIIVNGMGPFDFRIMWYGRLARQNIFINHTSWHLWHTEVVPRRYGPLTILARSAWKRHLANGCAHVVCTLDEVRESVTRFCPDLAQKSSVIPHSVDFSEAIELLEPDLTTSMADDHKVGPAEGEGSNHERGPLRLLFVGKLIAEKGIADLFEIKRRLEETRVLLTIVGDGPLRLFVESEAAKSPEIDYRGRVDDRKILGELFLSHDVLLVPSVRTSTWEELFGIVVIEGMHNGLCVLASNHVGPRNLIRDGKNGLLLPEKSPSAWARAIDSLAHDLGSLDLIQKQARRDARRYHTKNVAASWLSLFQTLGSKKDSPIDCP